MGRKPASLIAADSHIGARLRALRLMRGKSQTELAEAMGLTFQQVQKYEKGSNRLSGSRMMQAAKFLGEPASFFFEGMPGYTGEAHIGGGADTDETRKFLTSRHGHAIVKAFATIDDTRMRTLFVLLIQQIAAITGRAASGERVRQKA